ncbi:MAG: cytochrome d ubiquinol oxidase subunit II [Ilumatobacteraceae bacterium]
MSLADVVAALLFLGVLAYAVLGGADFGSGWWDLVAGDAARGGPLRTLVDRVIGPVWEANHVWLIYVLVYLWTGFPTAFAAVMDTLFVPFGLAGLGIVARGGAFAFRKFAPTVATARVFGVLFATSSVATPFLFGAIAGAIASEQGAGRRRRRSMDELDRTHLARRWHLGRAHVRLPGRDVPDGGGRAATTWSWPLGAGRGRWAPGS